MRVVADTNTVVSGLLWHGAPRQVLDNARSGKIKLFTSASLLAELEDVLYREKFTERFNIANIKPRDLILGYSALATVVRPAIIQDLIIEDDPDDDAVLACAIAAHAKFIVLGDRHLLKLKRYEEIQIVTANEFLSI